MSVPVSRVSASSALRFATGFVVYTLLVALAGALIAWPIWKLLGLFGLATESFHKLVLRAVQLVALVGVWPLSRLLGGSPREDFALRLGSGFRRELGNGLLMGIAGMLVLAVALLALGVRVPDESADLSATRTMALLVLVPVGALLIALIEETWFRGGLHGVARRHIGVPGAVLLGCSLFALVHYARADIPIEPGDVRWWSGIEVMRHAFDRLWLRDRVFDSLVALFLLGVMLVALRERSGRLALSIGVHAGSVMVIRVLREYTVVDAEAAGAWLVGTYDGVIGWLGALWMGVLIVVIVRSRRLPGAVPAVAT